jgi:hypothetical protein
MITKGWREIVGVGDRERLVKRGMRNVRNWIPLVLQNS